MIFGVGIGRREGFDAMTGREAISAQDICFRDVAVGVAGGVNGNEISEVDFWCVTGGVSINAGLLDGESVAESVSSAIVIVAGSLGVEVAKNVDFAIDALNVRSAVTAFDVEGNVDIAISFDVDFSISYAGFVSF